MAGGDDEDYLRLALTPLCMNVTDTFIFWTSTARPAEIQVLKIIYDLIYKQSAFCDGEAFIQNIVLPIIATVHKWTIQAGGGTLVIVETKQMVSLP